MAESKLFAYRVTGQNSDRRGGAQRVSQGVLSKSLEGEGAEAGDEN